MIKKGLGKLLAVVGLLSAPGAVAVSAAPQAEIVQAPAPYKNTDGRATRYFVPKGVRKRDRSRLPKFMEAVFGPERGCNRNRFARRAVCKAFIAGRGRHENTFVKKATQRVRLDHTNELGQGVLVPTTRRARERAKRVISYVRMVQAREVARRVLEATQAQAGGVP